MRRTRRKRGQRETERGTRAAGVRTNSNAHTQAEISSESAVSRPSFEAFVHTGVCASRGSLLHASLMLTIDENKQQKQENDQAKESRSMPRYGRTMCRRGDVEKGELQHGNRGEAGQRRALGYTGEKKQQRQNNTYAKAVDFAPRTHLPWQGGREKERKEWVRRGVQSGYVVRRALVCVCVWVWLYGVQHVEGRGHTCATAPIHPPGHAHQHMHPRTPCGGKEKK